MENNNLRFINCTFIDALSTKLRDAHISSVNGEISEVSANAFPHNVDIQTVDLNGKYLLPGLWDVHTHIGKGIPDHEARDETTAQRTIRAGDNGRQALNLGITSLRAVGEKDL